MQAKSFTPYIKRILKEIVFADLKKIIMAGGGPDMELRKAFTELQAKMVDSKQVSFFLNVFFLYRNTYVYKELRSI